MSRTRSLSKLIGPSGSQAFDTNTLVIDAANNRVGILNSAPTSALDVGGGVRSLWTTPLAANQQTSTAHNTWFKLGKLSISPQGSAEIILHGVRGSYTQQSEISNRTTILIRGGSYTNYLDGTWWTEGENAAGAAGVCFVYAGTANQFYIYVKYYNYASLEHTVTTGGEWVSDLVGTGSGTLPAGGVEFNSQRAFYQGAVEAMSLYTNAAVINEGAAAYDFRVESTTNTHLLFCEGSASGLVHVGKSAGNFANAGLTCYPQGEINVTSNDDRIPVYLNRQQSDGGIIAFYRTSNTLVGSINVTSSGTTYNTTSDRRLKTDIQPIADGTEKLMAMNPVTHTWKADPEAPAVHGFIAQEMQDVVPEAVSGDAESDEMLSMDYGRITPIIVAALQDALKEIEGLKTRIAELEAK